MIKSGTLFLKLLVSLVLGVLCIGWAFYMSSVVYEFPVTQPFAGNIWYNPYQQVGHWPTHKANFHAHSKAWANLSNGEDTAPELSDFYRKKGYGFGGLSNYFRLTPENHPFQVYEHGINIFKVHKLAINPASVLYFDYPLWQTLSHKQDIIERLHGLNALVAIAHPNFHEGHPTTDMQQLVGYDFTEIRSYYANAQPHWDSALVSGKLSWLLCNDDTHGIKKQPPQRFYNVVFSPSVDSLLRHMQLGRHYGIEVKSDTNDLTLSELRITSGDTLAYQISGADTVSVWSDGNLISKQIGGAGRLKLPSDASYVRLVGESARAKLLTNPIVRTTDGRPPLVTQIRPLVKDWATLATRTLYLVLLLLTVFALKQIWK